MMVTAVTSALACAATYAISTSVQHHAAEDAPDAAHSAIKLLAHLVQKPLWLLGQVLATLAFALHAFALHSGPLALVQPIVVSGIVFAVPARAALSQQVPSGRELGAVVLTAVGLAGFLVASRPTAGNGSGHSLEAGILVGIGVCIAGASQVLAVRTLHHSHRRAFFLGITAGVLFGMVAGLLKMSLAALNSDGIVGVLTAWPTWALIVVGAGGVLTNQRAYQVAPLSASMPVLNIVNVLVALTFGFTVFHEIPQHSPLALLLEAAALVCMAAGLWSLATSEDLLERAAVATAGHADKQ
jgi:hypothetical protein